MKIISTRLHGVLDYLTVGLLLALPRVLGWGVKPSGVLTSSAFSTLIYSLLTRYELGVVKVLPFKGHLALDTISAATLLSAPLTLLHDEDADVKATFVALGVYELTAILLSKTAPSRSERASLLLQDVADKARELGGKSS